MSDASALPKPSTDPSTNGNGIDAQKVKPTANSGPLRWTVLLVFLIALPLLYVFLAAEQWQGYRETHQDVSAHTLTYRQFSVNDHKDQTDRPDLCNAWSMQSVLFPNETSKHTVKFSRYEKNRDIIVAQWNPDGPFPVPVYFPYGTPCVVGRAAKPGESSKPVGASPEQMLCTHDGGNYTELPILRTVVVKVGEDEASYRSLLGVAGADESGLDLWGFHSQFLSHLVAMYVTDVSVVQFNGTMKPADLGFTRPEVNTIPASTLLPPVDVVLLLPDAAWPLVTGNSSKVPFGTSSRTLSAIYASANPDKVDVRALAALQAYSDGLDGQVLVAAHSTALNDVQALMGRLGMEKRAKVWVEPVYGQLLKTLETSEDLISNDYEDPTGTACFGSVIHQYALTFLRNKAPETTSSMARHVCFVARQNTSVTSDAPVRNLRHDVFQEMVKRIASPIVLAPQARLREWVDDVSEGDKVGDATTSSKQQSEEETGMERYPLLLDRSSVCGQMKFVYHECAVLVGTQGSGLIHALALRPGSHVIELYASEPTPVVRNLAALVHNVSYTNFKMSAGKQTRGKDGDLYASQEDMDKLVDLINAKLSRSVKFQHDALGLGSGTR